MGIDITKIHDPVKRRLYELAAAGVPVRVGGSKITMPAAVVSPGNLALVLPQKPAKRLRQSEDDCKLNKLEAAWLEHLKRTLPPEAVGTLKVQSIRVRCANGGWYKGDISAVVNGRLTIYECKGPNKVKGCAKGTFTVKVAASLFPEFAFIFVWRTKGQWHTQRVLP